MCNNSGSLFNILLTLSLSINITVAEADKLFFTLFNVYVNLILFQ